jgi:hypothetical protein
MPPTKKQRKSGVIAKIKRVFSRKTQPWYTAPPLRGATTKSPPQVKFLQPLWNMFWFCCILQMMKRTRFSLLEFRIFYSWWLSGAVIPPKTGVLTAQNLYVVLKLSPDTGL